MALILKNKNWLFATARTSEDDLKKLGSAQRASFCSYNKHITDVQSCLLGYTAV
jgi:hypothetical protein